MISHIGIRDETGAPRQAPRTKYSTMSSYYIRTADTHTPYENLSVDVAARKVVSSSGEVYDTAAEE